ncbi:cytochrome c3 family protein [Geobacter sulfurreducens]|jgi:cytochrome b subunit of formate dehydrogenase|uniref:cytochrome c3 family protein n=1 Tax=Geobacter sulfurreducens TaxID=35554 RepID=UPI0001D8F37C|nr:cytochrome c3 family protein [Geobacter sulfurreducens]ADI83109.1 cytochrome c, 9 heme-binding sites, and cytochrome b [Geobacter sulfurreducens KN400]AJY70002.1 cytochrome C [Geobacter sulfurreducens]QVW35543.1 cytochrome c3 family protein [Geobacter sulfurreducens]UTG92982.1 cytochrome c3 family protein [Geobacter sulfurreducens]BBA68822.1 C-type multiheme cytochrome [Geobacter sulfurreducens]
MLSTFLRLFPAFLLFVTLAGTAAAESGMAIDPATCLGCHSNKISAAAFSASVHGKNACTSCHVEITDLTKHMKGEVKVEKVRCERCHKKENAEHYASVHAQKDVRCADCHTDIHTHSYWNKDKRKVVAKCIQCHDKEAGYRNSIHGKGVAAGNMDSAACNDCHNLHDIKPLGDPKSKENREFHTKVCLKCHADEKMMERNNVFTVAVKTYMDSYHGKNYRLGFPEKVAGCADCHTAHGVLPAKDPNSSVNPQNLVATCAKCHPKATPLFTKFYSHGELGDREKYPILYYTFIAMTGLLVSTFAVFWIHTLLWMFRGFVENREKQQALIHGHAEHHIPDGHKVYRRFKRRHIFLHLLVIISFLILSLSGLPLKFSSQHWAKFMMDHIFGHSANAALVHRIGAGITFVYFAGALLLSFHFLFVRKDIKGNWLQRMFGPDSLMPNFRDIKDVAGMVRWFLFRGPKPTFERWTYWEKFDFIAVFWGMFAIGGSGLMLWFPEFFGSFLPGWMFNVATIVHSDEALLATGFIFTVHFFNTHGRPEKFPMDFVIFNGQMPKHEFIEERGDQWKRYEELGITEEFAAKKTSGVVYDFIVKGFGFTAVVIGLTLVVLMLYAFLSGGAH